ncbi:hypothetical protein HNQ94_002112 [Salirhabdus euzebyi]|uniref:Lipoprotein n=1 Tax=Salirhabdus euzebyi TaxID=394506 RepID=A0A841Q5M7_9BACI|nr:hypothetical protein [Salirhabdus euzebyi]MBB6453663.1 hypothetical protein [Salirhabdus euzebyi]
MKKAIISLGFFLMLALVGCSNPVQDDLLSYVNDELIPISQLEVDAMDAYASVTGVNYTDDYTLYDVLEVTVLPNYEDFYEKLNLITPKTEEVKEIHDIYVEGVGEQYQALLTLRVAIETQSLDEVNAANEKLMSGTQKINDFRFQLQKLAGENDVELEDF